MNKRGARAIAIIAGSTGGTVGGFVAGTIVSALAGAGGMSIVIVIAATLGGALGHGISVAVAFGIEFLVRPVRPTRLRDALIAIVAGFVGWSAFYVCFLSAQGQWQPGIFVSVTSIASAVLIFLVLRVLAPSIEQSGDG